jgi:uncharacterized protein (DUF697 family)
MAVLGNFQAVAPPFVLDSLRRAGKNLLCFALVSVWEPVLIADQRMGRMSMSENDDLAEKRRKAEAWVNGYTATAVAAVVATSPIPGTATGVLCTLEATMCYQIGRIYKTNWSIGEATAAAGVIGIAAFLGKIAALEALTFLPFAGWVAKGVIAAGIVKGMGQLVIKHFEHCA